MLFFNLFIKYKDRYDVLVEKYIGKLVLKCIYVILLVVMFCFVWFVLCLWIECNVFVRKGLFFVWYGLIYLFILCLNSIKWMFIDKDDD